MSHVVGMVKYFSHSNQLFLLAASHFVLSDIIFQETLFTYFASKKNKKLFTYFVITVFFLLINKQKY
jgi:hypothetical protein